MFRCGRNLFRRPLMEVDLCGLCCTTISIDGSLILSFSICLIDASCSMFL